MAADRRDAGGRYKPTPANPMIRQGRTLLTRCAEDCETGVVRGAKPTLMETLMTKMLTASIAAMTLAIATAAAPTAAAVRCPGCSANRRPLRHRATSIIRPIMNLSRRPAIGTAFRYMTLTAK